MFHRFRSNPSQRSLLESAVPGIPEMDENHSRISSSTDVSPRWRIPKRTNQNSPISGFPIQSASTLFDFPCNPVSFQRLLCAIAKGSLFDRSSCDEFDSQTSPSSFVRCAESFLSLKTKSPYRRTTWTLISNMASWKESGWIESKSLQSNKDAR